MDWKTKMRDSLEASGPVELGPLSRTDRASAVKKILDGRVARLAGDGPFQQLESKLEHEKNPPSDPAATAAKIGREKLGQAEMTRRSVAGRKETDTEFFEGPEGYVHPIRGTKGYSRGKAGDPRKSRR